MSSGPRLSTWLETHFTSSIHELRRGLVLEHSEGPVATTPKTAAKEESGDTGNRKVRVWPILTKKEEKEQEIKVKLWGRR